MKNRFKISTACLLACFGSLSCKPAAEQLPPEQTLKEAFNDSFLIGAGLNESHFAEPDPAREDLVASQFNTITPEDVLKWETVHPEPNRYDFEPADRCVSFGEKHGMFIVGHTLVWHQQLPPWVFEENGKPASRETLTERMRTHIHSVVGRYKGRIKGWDVVNEALDEDGSLRQSPWLEILGEDYIRMAFEFAHEADPEAELYYNDYSLENEAKRMGAVRLVKSLKSAGVRIDGVGLQGHVQLKWPTLDQVDKTLAAIGRLGVKAMITELDIDILPGPDLGGSAEVSLRHAANPKLNPYSAGLPDDMQQTLARRYADLFSIYLKHRETLNRVTFWGVTDGDSWLNEWPVPGRSSHPLLFDRQAVAKPAFKAVVETSNTTTPEVAAVDTTKPNIVIFIADDLAWHDVACFGGPTDARTPNLDQLATEGIKLTGFHSSAAVCSPTRQALLTGMFPVRSGAYPNHAMVKPRTRSLPHHLKPLGYRTVGAGKKHFDPQESYPFDLWLPMLAEDRSKGIDGDVDFKGLEQFINDDSERPFCAYIATHEPHGPWTKGDQSAYDPAALKNIAPYLVDTPELRQSLANYYAEVSLCDDQVGTLMETLRRTGKDRNTIFIFASEQGSAVPQGKWSLYNPGIRVAAIARWPGKIEPGGSNGALVQYVDLLPTLIEAAGGDPNKSDTGQADAAGDRGFDGSSILNVLLNKTNKHRDLVFAQHTTRGIINGSEAYGTRAVSNGRWKLLLNLEPDNEFTNVISEGGVIKSWRRKGEQGDEFAARQAARYARRPSIELYDLDSDPWELVNVADKPENAPILARLRSELDAWMTQQGDQGHQTELEALDHQPGGHRTKKKPEAKNTDAANPKSIDATRESLFGKKDSDHDGRLSPQEFLANQSESESDRAKKRLAMGDSNRDGFISRDEFFSLPVKKPVGN